MARLLILWLVLSGAAQAEDIYQFSNPVDRARFEHFTAELRCPQCQNQSIGDSDSMQAEDLRRDLYEQIQAGRSDKEITDEMVRRYGNYILYRPPLNSSTVVLWVLPVVLLIIGIVVVLVMVRKRKAAEGQRQLTPKEQADIEAMLAEHDRKGATSEKDS